MSLVRHWHYTKTLQTGFFLFFHENQVNGKVYIIYDVGNGPQTLIEDRQNFNDGQYHYVQFVRNGAGATLRVDDYATRSVGAGGKVAWSLPRWWWWYCLLCSCVVVETRKEAMPMTCFKSFHKTCVDGVCNINKGQLWLCNICGHHALWHATGNVYPYHVCPWLLMSGPVLLFVIFLGIHIILSPFECRPKKKKKKIRIAQMFHHSVLERCNWRIYGLIKQILQPVLNTTQQLRIA